MCSFIYTFIQFDAALNVLGFSIKGCNGLNYLFLTLFFRPFSLNCDILSFPFIHFFFIVLVLTYFRKTFLTVSKLYDCISKTFDNFIVKQLNEYSKSFNCSFQFFFFFANETWIDIMYKKRWAENDCRRLC